jgi:hypothetical protein
MFILECWKSEEKGNYFVETSNGPLAETTTDISKAKTFATKKQAEHKAVLLWDTKQGIFEAVPQY